MFIAWRYDLRPTWRVHLVYRLRGKAIFTGRAAQRLESLLTETGRVRAPRVTLAGASATVDCIVKGVDDVEAVYVALGYVDTAVAETQGLDLGDLTFRSMALHLPPSMGDDDS